MNINYNNYKININSKDVGYADIIALYQNNNYKYIINRKLRKSLIGFNNIKDFTFQKSKFNQLYSTK